MASQKIKYLDVWHETNKNLVFEKKITSENGLGLLGNYPVDVENHVDFSFMLKKKASEVALFTAKIEGDGISAEESRWSYVCDLKDRHEN